MTKPCVVPKCKTGYPSETSKRSVFRVPKNVEQLQKWLAAIPGIVALKSTHVVCDKHFEEKDIIREWIKRDENGQVIARAPYKYPQLNKLAVPSKFDDLSTPKGGNEMLPDAQLVLPMQFCETEPLGAASVAVEGMAVPVIYSPIDDSPAETTTSDMLPALDDAEVSSQIKLTAIESPVAASIAREDASVHLVHSSIEESFTEKASSTVMPSLTNDQLVSPREVFDPPQVVASTAFEGPVSIRSSVATKKYVEIESGRSCEEISAQLPEFWSVGKVATPNGHNTLFSYAITRLENGKRLPVTQKCVTLDVDRKLVYTVYGRAVEPEKMNLAETIEEIQKLPIVLDKFKGMNVCIGLGDVNINYLPASSVFQDGILEWRSQECSLLFKKRRCDSCSKLRKRAQLQKYREKNRSTYKCIRGVSNPVDSRKMVALRLKARKQRYQRNRANARVKHLISCVKKQQEEIANIQESSFEEKCCGLKVPAAQKNALKEIIAAAGKKDARGRRYSEDWMMLCMLMNIRSPGYYEFLRKNNVLPLPCSRTVRTYFSLINMKCGFDEQFAELLKKHLAAKTPLQRHGVLLLDEINLRKSIAVCSKNLTYVGLTDLGDDGHRSSDISEQATHGLVIMFQSIADTYTQPIAVFASKNPVKGEELAKLVVKGITYLEECGAIIHGVIADGAATNAKMWSLLGVSGTMENLKTWFTHPLNDERKVFVFSDTPHVIKNIRNRLLNKRKLRLNSNENYISWRYFEALYELDRVHPGNARACPKITERHVNVDNASKMRVKLATQIFSNSVAQGLSFYLSHKCKALTGCEATIAFCKQINDMFDALNRKSPNQGLTPDSKDFKVLEDSLQWLNNWENAMVKGDITPEEFLTTPTSRGLRITLRSTMDMCQYLIEKFSFQYLLSGKVNQDNLEKFFGTIRQSAGCNDHPNCPTFLQLYKLLSVYSVIKPPKFGNCTVSQDRVPSNLISISDLKAVYSGKGEAKSAQYLRGIKEKLDAVLEHEDWEVDDVIRNDGLSTSDHDYVLSPMLDCIIYYVTGYLCKQVLKRYQSCTTCIQAVKINSGCTSSVGQLVELKSRGGLIHANLRFFHLIRYVEETFSKYCNSIDVFDQTLDEVLGTYSFSFPCKEHASEVLAYAIMYYIRLRMRQNAHQENSKMKKKFVIKNKLAKLTDQ